MINGCAPAIKENFFIFEIYKIGGKVAVIDKLIIFGGECAF